MTEQDSSTNQQTGNIAVTGRFDQYRSSYWAAAVAVLGVRYAPRPFLRKHWDDPAASHLNKHKYAGFAGTFMQGVTAFYALRTWKDMKSIFSQTVAWELDKDPKDVTFSDFRNSKNTIVQQTVKNYMSYNLRRFAVNSAFFIPFITQPLLKNKSWFKNMHAETGVDFGMAANAAYLFSDVISRKITPFEEIQTLIDQKINQSDHYAEKINAHDLLDVYERHAAEGKVQSFLSKRGTKEWAEVEQLFDRMADLMNQTHKNIEPHEQANFSFSKFIYLVGNGLMDPNHMDQSLTLIEIANKDGVGAVKKASQKLTDGAPLEQIKEEYAITQPKALESAEVETPSPIVSSQMDIQASAIGNHKNSNNKADIGLVYQDKIRKQAAQSSEGLTA